MIGGIPQGFILEPIEQTEKLEADLKSLSKIDDSMVVKRSTRRVARCATITVPPRAGGLDSLRRRLLESTSICSKHDNAVISFPG